MISDLTGLINEFTKHIGDATGISGRILAPLVILMIGLIGIKVLLALLRHSMKRSSRLDPALHTFIANCVKIICLVLLMIMVLSALGVPTASFITVLGAAGAAVALALRDSLSNIAGGIILLVTTPFKRSDYIEVQGFLGRVMEIDLLNTKLKTLDQKMITIPNSILSNQVITNHSAQPVRRIDMEAGISYDGDLEAARKAVMRAVSGSDYYLKDPPPEVVVRAHGDNAVLLTVRVWCRTENYFSGRDHLLEYIKREFDKSGIVIPYPQVVVHREPDHGTDGKNDWNSPSDDTRNAGGMA